MSNWRPHGLFNVARCDLFKLNYHLILKVIHKIWIIFVHFAIKLAKICLKLTQRVICISKLRPAVSFSSFSTQCAARTVIEFDMPALGLTWFTVILIHYLFKFTHPYFLRAEKWVDFGLGKGLNTLDIFCVKYFDKNIKTFW